MEDGQLDLFAAADIRKPVPSAASPPQPEPIEPARLTDAALIAAIPDADLATSRALAGEAARRKLVAAIPALAALCRRFKGFGRHHAIPEQAASLQALAAIGGADAVAAVRRIIADGVVSGPGQSEAARAAAALGCSLPEHAATALLLHADPAIRALACRCAPRTDPVAALLVNLLEDLNSGVAAAAAKALGHMGRAEAGPWLTGLLRQNPDAELLEAVAPVADDDCVVLIGRIARQHPDLRAAALAALEAVETPRAAAIVAALCSRDVPRPER